MTGRLPVIRQLACQTAREARRGRVLPFCGICLAIVVCLGTFAESLMLADGRETRIALVAPLLRLLAVVLTTLFVQSSVIRERESRELDMLLSLAMSRATYYLGRTAGYVLVAAMIAVVLSAPFWFWCPPAAAAVWLLTLLLEISIVAGVSQVLASSFRSLPVGVLLTMATYLFMRSLDVLRLIAASPMTDPGQPGNRLMGGFFELLARLLPPLARYAQTNWLLEAGPSLTDVFRLVGETAVFLALVTVAGCIDLSRKNL